MALHEALSNLEKVAFLKGSHAPRTRKGVLRRAWVRQWQQPAETFKEATLYSGAELAVEAVLNCFTSLAVASPVENIDLKGNGCSD